MERRARILLVDDDPDFLEATKTVLESRPYEVIVADGGEAGLQKARAEAPDLVILDIIMPGVDGFTVCRQLKADPKTERIPVMMLTSLSEKIGETSYSLSDGMGLEADDFIDKPVRPAELLLRVERILRLRGGGEA